MFEIYLQGVFFAFFSVMVQFFWFLIKSNGARSHNFGLLGKKFSWFNGFYVVPSVDYAVGDNRENFLNDFEFNIFCYFYRLFFVTFSWLYVLVLFLFFFIFVWEYIIRFRFVPEEVLIANYNWTFVRLTNEAEAKEVYEVLYGIKKL
jgi:hypothetical protein